MGERAINKRLIVTFAVILIVTIGAAIGLQVSGVFAPGSYDSQRQQLVISNEYPQAELSDAEKAVDAKMQQLKAELISQEGTEAYKMRILTNDALTSSGLYEFSTTLPKGGELHAHSTAIMSFATMLEFAQENDAYVCVDQGEGRGHLGSASQKPRGCDGEPVLLKDALNSGQITVDELEESWTLTNHTGDLAPWDSFDARNTNAVKGFLYSPGITDKYYRTAFEYYAEQGASVVELRSTPGDLSDPAEYEETLSQLKQMRQAYYDVKAEHPELVVRIIIAPSHRMPSADAAYMTPVLEKSIQLFNELYDETASGPEHFIAGFDMVSEEDKCFPLSEYQEMFANTKLPEGFKLYLHCGESLLFDDTNMMDAYLYGAVRVGHGTNLYRYPELMSKYKAAGIAIEVCPISNMQLGYVNDLRLHPAAEYLKRGLNVTLSSDDATYMENLTLVDDYFAAILCWDLDLSQVKMLSKNAVLCSSLTGEQREKALQNWQASWDAWIAKAA